ncbi:MAG: hypothetical protein ACJAVI_003994 [Candidatus Azotimanducaceae bacterium]|jgi:hypothetical protein
MPFQRPDYPFFADQDVVETFGVWSKIRVELQIAAIDVR